MDNITDETKRSILEDFLCHAGVSRLIEYLEGLGMYSAPAAKSHHGAEYGGLFNHSLQVAYELTQLTMKLDLKWERPESPAIIGMLHDVCKLDDYIMSIKPHELEDKTVRGERVIEWNKERAYPGHGDKSLIMLMGYADLTEEEKMCIRYHMGAFTDQKEWEFYSRAVNKYPNVLYTHMADMISSQIKGI